MGSDEELSRRMRHNGIHPDSLPGEAGKQVRVGVWAPENRFLAPAGNVVAEGSEGEPHENIPLGKGTSESLSSLGAKQYGELVSKGCSPPEEGGTRKP